MLPPYSVVVVDLMLMMVFATAYTRYLSNTKLRKRKIIGKKKSVKIMTVGRALHTLSEHTQSASQPAIKKTPTLDVFGTSSLFFFVLCVNKNKQN